MGLTRKLVRSQHTGALGLYFLLSLLLFGPELAGGLGDRLVAHDSGDASIFVWSLAWWPHALAEAANPLFTTAVWAPTGINLAWITTVPGPSLIGAPLTAAAGPVVTFNVLAVLAPVLCSWSAFLLCRHLTKRFVPSLLGGFIYGFSAYRLLETTGGHLNLTLTALVPLTAYLVVRAVQGSLSNKRFIVAMSAALLLQFAISIEVFATLTMTGAAALLVAYVASDTATRVPLRRVVRLLGLCVLIVAVLAAPFLYVAFAYPQPIKGCNPLRLFDHARAGRGILGLAVPGRLTAIGRGLLDLPGPAAGWYLGLPLLGILGHLYIRHPNRRRARGVAVGAILLLVAMLGPRLSFGDQVVSMPWALMRGVPLLNKAMPARLVDYLFLIAAVGVAAWLATAPRSKLRLGAAVLVFASLLPNFTLGWVGSISRPELITSSAIRELVRPTDTVVVATRVRGEELLFQAESGYAFRLSRAYLGLRPGTYRGLRLIQALSQGDVGPSDREELRAALAANRITAVLLSPSLDADATERIAEALGVRVRTEGGMQIARLDNTGPRQPVPAEDPCVSSD